MALKFSLFPTPALMGIINVNNQSFYKPSRMYSLETIIEKVHTMIQEGAHIIDIGGQSTHPKAIPISEDDEWNHIATCINQLPKIFPHTLFSIDTFFASIADRALSAGFHIVNDVYGGDYDKNMYHVIAQHKATFVCTHHFRRVENPPERNVVQEVQSFFDKKITLLTNYGIRNIILDVGIGFGKTQTENFQLIKALPHLQDYQYPLLVGVSRKSFIYNTLHITPEQSLNGTTVMHTLALNAGAHILRVHDVAIAQEVLTLYQAYEQHTLIN